MAVTTCVRRWQPSVVLSTPGSVNITHAPIQETQQMHRPGLLREIHALESVVSTKSFVVLSTYLERPTQAETSARWDDPPLPRE